MSACPLSTSIISFSKTFVSAVSTPFSYSCKKTPKDAENQVEAALGAARAIKAAHGTSFSVS